MHGTPTDSSFLSQTEKDRMIGHMNDDHADAVLNYVRAFTGARSANQARLLDIARDAMAVEYHTEQGRNICRIPFAQPLSSKDEVRSALVQLAQLARERLGIN
jgi:putative heme iron utilization protein